MTPFDRKKIKQLQVYEDVLSSIVFVNESASYYQQNPSLASKRVRELEKELLKWHITDEKSLHERLDWLLSKGTRQRFGKIYTKLACMEEGQRERYLAFYPSGSEERIELEVVHYYLHRVPRIGIMAYDLTWVAYLIKSAYALKKLTNLERLTYLDRAVSAMNDYDWNRRDYINSFIIGSTFNSQCTNPEYNWQNDPQGTANHNRANYARLIASKWSPFRKIGL
jgi:hypothetical protein